MGMLSSLLSSTLGGQTGMAACNIHLIDDSNNDISQAEIRIYSANTSVVLAGGTTDSVGVFSCLLPNGDYDLRAYKAGLTILPRQPQRLVLDDTDPEGNTFTVTGKFFTPLEATNPLECRVSGFLYGPDGELANDVRISLVPALDLNIVGSTAVVPRRTKRVSGGQFDFTLIRGLKYLAYFEGVEDFLGTTPAEFILQVPDRASISITDLLFPIPIDVTFSAPSLTLVAGGEVNNTISYVVTYSDGSTRTKLVPWVSLNQHHTNDSIIDISCMEGSVAIRPIRAGTDVLTFERAFSSLVNWIGAPAFTSDSLTITVS